MKSGKMEHGFRMFHVAVPCTSPQGHHGHHVSVGCWLGVEVGRFADPVHHQESGTCDSWVP